MANLEEGETPEWLRDAAESRGTESNPIISNAEPPPLNSFAMDQAIDRSATRAAGQALGTSQVYAAFLSHALALACMITVGIWVSQDAMGGGG
eukprot:10846289-Ditylum_brightwellii.AAC.1